MKIKDMISVTKIWTRNHKADILMFAGIGLTIGGTFLFVKNTLTVKDDVIEPTKNDLSRIHSLKNNNELNDRDYVGELIKAYGKGLGRAAKKYGLALALTTGGYGMILTGRHMMAVRNTAIAAAYKSLQESYHAYRKRVVEEYGPEVDDKIFRGRVANYVEADVTNDRGEEEHVVATVMDEDPEMHQFWIEVTPLTYGSRYSKSADQIKIQLQEGIDNVRFKYNLNRYMHVDDIFEECGISKRFLPVEAHYKGFFDDPNLKFGAIPDINIIERPIYNEDGIANMHEKRIFLTVDDAIDIDTKVFLAKYDKER